MSEKKPVDPHEETHAESIAPGKLVAGAAIGGYELLSVLGEGGMGVVWSARDPLLDRTLAIKVLKRGDAAPALRMRLLREARAMARLKHPNVLTVYEVGTEGERDFIAMELVEGGPLDDWLARDPPRDNVIAALLAAGRGLAFVHAAGLVHRDFKPNNVLRSRDGRVLVTDFGLARGLSDDPQATPATGEIGAHDETHDATSTRPVDSVLHSPLTKTGAMIGTPAYMAPEQFAGAPPDPRTDQFAYCVTAWQALTGVRPFHGRTLDELRDAANAGVAGIVSELPKPIRAVLARGLDPDPVKRWPDLDTLLGEFERATKPPRRWGAVAAIVGGALVLALIVAALAGRGGSAPVATCEPATAVFGDADKLVAARFTETRTRWFTEYEAACRDGKPNVARIECLRGVRDRIAAFGEIARTGSNQTDLDVDPMLFVPHPSACATQAPRTSPALPVDRARALLVLRDGLALVDDTAVVKHGPIVEAHAKQIGWQPLVALVQIAAAHGYIRAGDSDLARQVLAAAIRTAEPVDLRLVALARLAILEASLHELVHPDEWPDTKPGAMHEELARNLVYARSAVTAAGDEPVLAGVLALHEARILADLAEQHPKKFPYGEALARVTAARRTFEQLGDLRRLAAAANLEAEILLARGDARALDDAEFATRSAAEAIERANGRPFVLDEVRERIAFARGYLEADDSLPSLTQRPGPGTPRAGVVLDPAGKPASGALVIAWAGELHGDALRLATRGRNRHVSTETHSDGVFGLTVPDGWAIVVQHRDTRSAPQVIANDQTIKLAPTGEVTGTVDMKHGVAVTAFARFSAAANAWFVHAPVGTDRAFRIRGLPNGTALHGTSGRAGMGTRRITTAPGKLVWPGGTMLDIVVRGVPTGTVWLFRGRVKPATRAELDVLATTSTDVVIAPLSRIGSRTTDAGRAIYASGDRHAIVTADGAFGTACVGHDDRVTCKALGEPEAAILVEVTASSNTR